MTSDSQLFDESFTAPTEFVGLQLVFAPTRTEYEVPKVEASADIRSVTFEQFVLVVQMVGLARAGATLRVTFDYRGEPMQILGEPNWLTHITVDPTEYSHYEEIHKARQVLAHGDPRQAFFFDIDRLTHKEFLVFSPELSDTGDRLNREKLVHQLRDDLWNVIYYRINGTAMPSIQSNVLSEVTSIFRDASQHLIKTPRPWTRGDVLLRFAAGDLRWPVQFTVNMHKHDYIVSEPDSSAILLFAELGMAGRKVDQHFWDLRLLFDLVKMQRYFFSRFDNPSGLGYNRPGRPLDPTSRAKIDAEYLRIAESGIDEQKLEALIEDNLCRCGAKICPRP